MSDFVLQRLDGIDLSLYCTKRKLVVQNLLRALGEYGVVFVRSSPCTGKTSLAKLCAAEYQENGYYCTVINGVIQKCNDMDLKQFKHNTKTSIVIIDEVQELYEKHEELWNAIRSTIQQQLSTPVHFLLFSSANDGHPIVNDIQFPKYYGTGLLLLSEEELQDLFSEFEQKFETFCSDSLGLPIIASLPPKVKNYINIMTDGHVGFVTICLNSLVSSYFRKHVQNFPRLETQNNPESDPNWVYQLYIQWFRSYEFYSILSTSRASPKLDDLTSEQSSVLQRMLLRYASSPEEPYVRIQDKILFLSLYQRRILRNADEKLGIGQEASVTLDASFCSPLTQQLCFQSLKQTNRSLIKASSVSDMIWDSLESMNPILLHQKSFSLSDDAFHFGQEFYQSISSNCPPESFLSPLSHPQSFTDTKQTKILLEISVSGELPCSIVLCHVPTFPLSFEEVSSVYEGIQQATFLPSHQIHCFFLSFPSLGRNEDFIIQSMPDNIYQGYIRKDFSGIDISYGNSEKKKEIIFSGHIRASLPPLTPPSTPHHTKISLPLISSPGTHVTHETELVKLFVGQIPRSFDEESLLPLFEPYGDIYELSIIRNKQTGTHRGCAFVSYSSPTSAERAIQHLHGIHTLPGQNRPMQVKLANSEHEKSEHKLFVGMIPENVSEKQLRKLFLRYGDVQELVILCSPDGTSKHCGFVKYANHSDAVGAINALNRSFIKKGSAHPLVVKFADTPKPLREIQQHIPMMWGFPPPPVLYTGQEQNSKLFVPSFQPSLSESRRPNHKKRTGPEGCNLFVIRIPPEWTDETLAMKFIPFGNVLSSTIFVDKETGNSRCFGFVSYDNPSSARLAIQNMDGLRINGKRLTVQLKKRDKPY